MRYKGLLEKEAVLISPHAFRQYVEERGWERISKVKGDMAIYRRPGSIEYEVMILNSVDYESYGRRTIESIHEIARFENREPDDVLHELIELSTLSEAEYFGEAEDVRNSSRGHVTPLEEGELSPNPPSRETSTVSSGSLSGESDR